MLGAANTDQPQPPSQPWMGRRGGAGRASDMPKEHGVQALILGGGSTSDRAIERSSGRALARTKDPGLVGVPLVTRLERGPRRSRRDSTAVVPRRARS